MSANVDERRGELRRKMYALSRASGISQGIPIHDAIEMVMDRDDLIRALREALAEVHGMRCGNCAAWTVNAGDTQTGRCESDVAHWHGAGHNTFAQWVCRDWRSKCDKCGQPSLRCVCGCGAVARP